MTVDTVPQTPKVYTTSNGCPTEKPESSLRASNMLLLRDFRLIELLSHLNRERIPERVVHAKGAGAYGEFETACLARFSTTAGERGSADSVRDARGFAVKCYTAEGNWDWVWNNVPFFFIRDPVKFPGLNREALHMVLWLYSDYGTFSSYRHMNGYMGHAHKWVMPDGSFKYVHMYLEADLGYKTHSDDDIPRLTGADPDLATRDLHDAIARGDYPTYTAKVQVIDPADVRKFGYNILDMTKHWDMGTYPADLGTVGARPFGRLTLNRNPENYFDEIEQAAFSPSHLVPGIEPSEDPLLQGRFFAYPDAQRYRLGVNYQQIPVNRPGSVFNPLLRDGAASVEGNYGSHPGYVTAKAPMQFRKLGSPSTPEHEQWVAEVMSEPAEKAAELDLKFARTFWTHLDDAKYEGWQGRMVTSLGRDIAGVEEGTREQVYQVLGEIHVELASRVSQEVSLILSNPQATR
ncbi:catalase-like domain-containing protein [Lasiosphaeris hirsuta]|uniref:Catalase-like domain-containing protein n=1 Tax=Lasiosphaeris hirsuta TaxID=260670 RepID=A0AA40B1Q1_9PEZI|nr:catalase-like domain-containing protein [Lasiosphaeris hirsuta]